MTCCKWDNEDNSWKDSQIDLLDSAMPDPINYSTCDNPYEALFGDKWEEEIKNHSLLKGFVCVTDLIEHMWSEIEKHYKDTVHKETWWVYHNTLSIMCEKVTINWMKEKGYYDRWILPELGLNDNLGLFGGKPVGNSPEFIPWHACLNNDVHESAHRLRSVPFNTQVSR